MLWTIMPEDVIFEESNKINSAEEYLYFNRKILALPAKEGKVKIVQLISSNPIDYLDPRFTPGNLVFAKKL